MSYVYAHYTLDGRLFYIGKGTGGRAWETRNRNRHWRNTVAKHGLEVRIIEDHLTEQQALDKERQLIAEVGLDHLTNIRPGGEGFTSEESRQLQHRLAKDPEHREKLSAGLRKRWANTTPEERQRHRERCRESSYIMTPEKKARKAHSGKNNGMYGKRHKPESLEKMRRKRGPCPALSGENNPAKRPDTRQKMSESRKNTPPVTCPLCGKTMSPQNFGKWHKNGKCENRG